MPQKGLEQVLLVPFIPHGAQETETDLVAAS